MDKNCIALTPPMGWNSWDCYGASVNEEQLRGNAEFMARYLKEYGWEYIVCDIQWYESTATSTEYHHFYPLEMDEYSRLLPATNRFPSAANGAGFRPIADYVHSLGLKFGIHIMRGIPRQAVHAATPVKGSNVTARDIASSYSICPWNTDMYGVNAKAEGAQEYYNSLFDLYASWGVDFIKVDDICNTEYKPHDPYSAREEVELIRNAMDQCGREMVLSLSPGPAVLSEAEHLCKHANMWRMTGDFWDNWDQLYAMFERCKQWSPFVAEGCWPDCDMLPLGHIAINNDDKNNTARFTNFTKDEQITMMTLWCIFRSPLMLGSELRDMDEFTMSLLTNSEVLEVHRTGSKPKEVLRTHDTVIWRSENADGSINVAFFNTAFASTYPEVNFMKLGIESGTYEVRDLWNRCDIGEVSERISAKVNIHGAVLYRLHKVR